MLAELEEEGIIAKSSVGERSISMWLNHKVGRTCACGFTMSRYEAFNGWCDACRRKAKDGE